MFALLFAAMLLRVSSNGKTPVFQTVNEGSIPFSRSDRAGSSSLAGVRDPLTLGVFGSTITGSSVPRTGGVRVCAESLSFARTGSLVVLLTRWSSRLGHLTLNQKVTGSIPVRVTKHAALRIWDAARLSPE